MGTGITGQPWQSDGCAKIEIYGCDHAGIPSMGYGLLNVRIERKWLRTIMTGTWFRPAPGLRRHKRQLARPGLARGGRTCSPSVPRASARDATAPISASAPATTKAALKLPVAATT